MKLDQHSLLEGTKLVVLISYLPPTLVNRLRLLEGEKSNFVQAKRSRSRQGGKKMQMQVRRERREGGRSSAANPVAAGRSKASSAGGARKLGQRPRQASCRAKGHGINSLHHLLGRGWGALVEEEVGGPTARGRRGAAAAYGTLALRGATVIIACGRGPAFRRRRWSR